MVAPEPEDSDRRLSERRRAEELETKLAALEIRVAILEVKVGALISTMNSRFDALDSGLKLILARVDRMDALKERMIGAFIFVSLIGVTGVTAWILAIAKILKVGP